MDDLPLRPAHELAGLIRASELSSVELLATYVHRVEGLDGAVHAVVTRADSVPAVDATSVARLRAAGAIARRLTAITGGFIPPPGY